MTSIGEKLLEAVRNGQVSDVEAMLNANSDPNTGNSYMRPLEMAIIENHLPIFNLLLDSGADVNLELCGATPMKFAIKYGRLEMLQKLHSKGAVMKPEYLEVAITEQQFEAVKFILDHCSDEMKEKVVADEFYMYTAFTHNNVKLVRLLRSYGWHYDVRSKTNEPVIIQLTKWNASDAIKELGENGIHFNVKDRIGMTPLLWSAIDVIVGVKTLKELLRHGAEVNQTCRLANESALFLSAQKGKLDKVKTLISYGADPNLRNTYGVSPLDVASECGFEDVVHCLLEAGARTSRQNAVRENIAQIMTAHNSTVKSLKHIARSAIRASLFRNNNSTMVLQLPLPKVLKTYVAFQDAL